MTKQHRKLSRSSSDTFQIMEYLTNYTVIICPLAQGNFKTLQENMSSNISPVHPITLSPTGRLKTQLKSLMKKARESGQDFYLSLIAWRNTPTEDMGSSPAQCLFSRRTKTSLPTATRLLEPEPVKQVRDKLYERKEIQAKYFNKGSKELPSLQEGEIVRMKPKAHDHAKTWVKAQVEKQVDVRSYAVRTEDGRQYRRNRKHL